MASYKTYTDGELVKLLQQSDEQAFTELYLRYWDKLFYLAAKKLEDLPAAESIVQDIFLEIWKRRGSLIIKSNIGGYLVVAVKYRIINEQARRYRRYQLERHLELNISEADHSTEQWLALEELQELLQQRVARLPERCRMAFGYREAGYTNREIARLMDISEKTVEMHVDRALKSLHTGLGAIIFLFISAR